MSGTCPLTIWSAFNAACLKGLRMAKAMLADEAAAV